MDFRYEFLLERGPADVYVPEDDEIHLALLGAIVLADDELETLRVLGDETMTRRQLTRFVAEATADHLPLSAAGLVRAIEAIEVLGYTIRWVYARVYDRSGPIDHAASASFLGQPWAGLS